MQSNTSIDVRLTQEGQFEVSVGEETRRGDLYYLGIDPRTRDHECSNELGLLRLVEGWITAIIDHDSADVFYLPFDFTDESTQWLACQKHDDKITIVCGWALVEGWSISPSDFQKAASELIGFQPDTPVNPQTFYRPRFLSDLRRVRAELAELVQSETT